MDGDEVENFAKGCHELEVLIKHSITFGGFSDRQVTSVLCFLLSQVLISQKDPDKALNQTIRVLTSRVIEAKNERS